MARLNNRNIVFVLDGIIEISLNGFMEIVDSAIESDPKTRQSLQRLVDFFIHVEMIAISEYVINVCSFYSNANFIFYQRQYSFQCGATAVKIIVVYK